MPKLLIVVAVVLVVLFALGLGLGASHGGPARADDRNANWTTNLNHLLVSSRPLEPRDVVQTCLGLPNCSIEPGVPVRIPIASAADRIRQARLHLVAGPSLRAELQQKGTLTQTKTVVTGGTETLDIYQRGGTLTLSCQPLALSAGPCRVALSS